MSGKKKDLERRRVSAVRPLGLSSETPSEDDYYRLRHGDELVLSVARTGEVLEVYRHDIRHKPQDKDWIKLYQQVFLELLTTRALRSSASWQVLVCLMCKTGFGNAVRITYPEIAEICGIARSSVARSVKELTKLGVVEVMGEGKKRGYRLNPNFAWRGTDQLRKARAARWAEEHQPRGSNPDLAEGKG